MCFHIFKETAGFFPARFSGAGDMKEGPAYTVINGRQVGSESGTGRPGELPWIPAIADPAGAGKADGETVIRQQRSDTIP
jgi:hypothetical protein